MDFENLQGILEVATTWGLKVLGGIALLVIGVIIARLARRGTAAALGRSSLDASLVDFLGKLIYYTVLSVILIAVFGALGIETASLITILGASSLAIGLALQGSLANLASGVMLFLFRPYHVGDYIEVGDYSGTVTEFGVFSTALDTLDNIRVVVPNRYISDHPVENWTSNGTRRIDLEVEIAIASELPAARQAIEQMLQAEPRVLNEPGPVVAVSDFGDTSARLVIRPWCSHTDFWDLRFALPERIKDALAQVGCTMPTPQRDIRLTQTD